MTLAKYTNNSSVPLSLAVFLATDNYDYDDTPHMISATALLKPIRQIVLAPRVPPSLALPDVADMFKSRLGSALHDGIERSWKHGNHVQALLDLGYPRNLVNRVVVNPSDQELEDNPRLIPVYLEQRLKRRLEGTKWTISGKFDFIGEGRVEDFKSTSTYTYTKQTNADKYVQQGSIYRWLDPKKITADEMAINYLFTDWKSGMVRADPGYPPKPFLRQVFTLMPLQATERLIRNKVRDIEQYMDADEEELPACTDDELWRSEPVFKYYKNKDKTGRSTKNFETLAEANLRFVQDGSVGLVKEVPGQVMACKYCPAFAVCSQKDSLIASGDLVMG